MKKYLFLICFSMNFCLKATSHNFVIIIPSYNNEKWAKRNLECIKNQTYPNYRVIYINDYSTDNTKQIVESFIEKNNLHQKFKLINNTQRRFKLENIYNAISSCNDNEVIIIVDGDDFLTNKNSLNIINQTYNNPNIWTTYGNFAIWENNGISELKCAPIPQYRIKNNNFRSPGARFYTPGHPFTCYAWLLKRIKLKHCLYNGRFAPAATDGIYIWNTLEMANTHVKFIPQKLYLYNKATQLNVAKTHGNIQNEIIHHLFRQKKYPPIKTPISPKNPTLTVCPVIFDPNQNQIKNIIETFQQIHIIKETIIVDTTNCIKDLETLKSSLRLIKAKNLSNIDLNEKIISLCSANYLLIGRIDNLHIQEINLKKLAKTLHQTFVKYGYLYQQFDLSPYYLNHLNNGVIALECPSQELSKKHLVLIQKKDLSSYFKTFFLKQKKNKLVLINLESKNEESK